jgi:hypothetical protein
LDFDLRFVRNRFDGLNLAGFRAFFLADFAGMMGVLVEG